MRWKNKNVESGCPFRDIARTPAENATGIDRSIPGRRVALTEALVADPPAPCFIDRPADLDLRYATADLRARNEWQVPLEFSHGAFRFGHAMVRPEYVINDLSTHDLTNTLEKTSANDPVNMPLDSTWIVRWSRFFKIAGSRPNFSRRIGPFLSDGLGHDRIFPAVDQTNRVGLLYRDLLGSAIAGLWSVDATIAEISIRRPQFIGLSRLLADRPYPVSQLREWLASEPSYGGLTSEDIETLANDPPLPFFILFEAMQQPEAEGLRLGPLGSIIVSEVIFNALEHNEVPVAHNARSLGEALAAISAQYYPTNVFADVPAIARMDQLVEFTAEIGDLRQAVPAFL
jgi:hypothetical protein